MTGNDIMIKTTDLFIEETKGICIKRDIPMCEHTTFKIGGSADLGAFPKNADELSKTAEAAKRLSIPYYTVGRGSNLLVSDEGFRGLIIFTTAMDPISFEGTRVTAGAGVNLTLLSRAATDRGLSGLEFASGIPGTVGGAIYMNAGAYGSEMKDIALSSDWISPTLGRGTFKGGEQGFGYRSSAYMGSDKTVVSCTLELTPGSSTEIAEKCRELMNARREKQPLEYPSAGSAFKRYPGRFTAQMIDEAGLRGFSVGGAAVSEKHAGFIINKGGATAADVAELIRQVRQRVYEKEGVMIEAEIRYLTPDGEVKL